MFQTEGAIYSQSSISEGVVYFDSDDHYLYARRSERATIFKAYFVFALTDGLLTIVLYALQFFNPA
ncbi:MAG: hypothetical protein GY832_37420 [Chloroflexi bacterium]|nr:hypothetical protein [Chloroflexota bacterium]